jgi:hypothetical protein
MRGALLVGLTERWASALDERRAMSPGSPVGLLDGLRRARGREAGQ